MSLPRRQKVGGLAPRRPVRAPQRSFRYFFLRAFFAFLAFFALPFFAFAFAFSAFDFGQPLPQLQACTSCCQIGLSLSVFSLHGNTKPAPASPPLFALSCSSEISFGL